MKKYLIPPFSSLLVAATVGMSPFALSACDITPTLTARTPENVPVIRAAILAGASGQTLRILDASALPEDFKNSPRLQAILDNSNTLYTFERNADGTLSLPLPAGTRPDSEGILELVITNNRTSQLVKLNTGPLVDFAAQAVQITPGNTVTLGTELMLQAQFEDNVSPEEFTLNWSVATSAQGQFQPLSGNDTRISWTPAQAGNYFVRIVLQERRTGATSTYTSPSPVVFVNGTDNIVNITPAGGQILAGDTLTLSANLPEAEGKNNLLWGFSQSPVGPFQPIAGSGQTLRWEPPFAGSYYLQIQIPQDSGELDAYVTSQAVVQVTNAENLVETVPESGEVIRGESITLRSTLEDLPAGTQYLWSYGNSPQGAFRAISQEGPEIRWIPEETGEFYLRLRTLIPTDGGIEEKTYTTSDVEVSVRDSDAIFALAPQPANLVQGQSVELALRDLEPNRTINWSFSPSPQAPFQSISGTGGTRGQNLRWNPPFAGNFFLRAEVTGGNTPNRTYTSATALVNVSQSSGVITVNRAISNLGQAVQLRANIPEPTGDETYTWSVSPSPVGPWELAQSLDTDTSGNTLNWYPPREGTYFIKTDVFKGGTVISFVSPRTLVQVNNQPRFFRTGPDPANIGTQGAVELTTNFFPPSGERFSYVWSRANAPMGPFTAIGGSLQLRFTWLMPGIPGNYFIKLDVISENTRKSVSFTSSNPIVFVGESSQTQTIPRF